MRTVLFHSERTGTRPSHSDDCVHTLAAKDASGGGQVVHLAKLDLRLTSVSNLIHCFTDEG
jgi:hypothetical protein